MLAEVRKFELGVLQQDFLLADWRISPSLNQISHNGTSVRVEPKVMSVLVCLVANAGKLVTKEQLIETVWKETFVSDQALTTAIWQLRHVFGESSKDPQLIQAIPKTGYRLLAVPSVVSETTESVLAMNAAPAEKPTEPAAVRQMSGRLLLLATMLVTVCAVMIYIAISYAQRAQWTKPSEWVRDESSIPAIVSREVFEAVQRIRPGRKNKTTCDELLRRCNRVLERRGKLSEDVLRDTLNAPSPSTLYRCSGDLWTLYKKLGYEPGNSRSLRETERQQTKSLRERILAQVASWSPVHIDVIEPAPAHRRMLLVDGVVPVALVICRSYQRESRGGWVAIPHPRERKNVTLLCLLDRDNRKPTAF
jgi:DNA-binding winged helix-turn-helix (wHTH) protein